MKLCGDTVMKSTVIYVHGKGGSADEAEHFKPLFPHSRVIGFSYGAQTPWEAAEEFPNFFAEHRKCSDNIILIAHSIGAFFSMSSLNETMVDKACFISPIVNMEKLICNMMISANVTERELAEKSEILTDFGETLSWRYLCYVRERPITWRVPTCILYGEHDNLTSAETVSDFSEKIGAELTVMLNGEHWFHTKEQIRFLDSWIRQSAVRKENS